jgi:glycosyltransferase involved in cell wall biosynthesis
MEAVLSDQALSAEMVAKGIARAKQFSWEKCASELLAVFDSLGKLQCAVGL